MLTPVHPSPLPTPDPGVAILTDSSQCWKQVFRVQAGGASPAVDRFQTLVHHPRSIPRSLVTYTSLLHIMNMRTVCLKTLGKVFKIQMAYLLISISMIKLTVSYSIPHTCSLLPFKMSTLTKIQRGSKSLTTGSNFFPTPQEDSFGAVLCLYVKATRGDERNVYFSTLRTEKTIIGQRRDIKYWH